MEARSESLVDFFIIRRNDPRGRRGTDGQAQEMILYSPRHTVVCSTWLAQGKGGTHKERLLAWLAGSQKEFSFDIGIRDPPRGPNYLECRKGNSCIAPSRSQRTEHPMTYSLSRTVRWGARSDIG